MPSWSPPRQVRWLTSDEWRIVSGVFGRTLPFRQRVFLTDAAGADRRAFAIPTSAISGGVFTALGALRGPVGMALTGSIQWATSAVNTGYIIGVGPARFGDMTQHPGLLVHEMTHVWQGRNRTFALSYALEAAFHQCRQEFGGPDPYAFTPGNPWASYNPEQQASIVEAWFGNGSSEDENDPLFPYIRDHVRRGRPS